MSAFKYYIGIDYSGAKAPVSRLAQLQVYESKVNSVPKRVEPYDKGAKNWCRKEVAKYVSELLIAKSNVIIGIDHGFSFPKSYFEKYRIKTWDGFLTYFTNEWQTERDHMYVDFARKRNSVGGKNTDYRLCECWASGAKSVFHFDVQGSVAKSTHAGLPWIKALRSDPEIRSKTHFWPFDGFDVPEDKSVVVEVFPTLFRRRFNREERTADQQDAYVVSAWLRDMDRRGAILDYFNPPLTLPERQQVRLEGWVFGVR